MGNIISRLSSPTQQRRINTECVICFRNTIETVFIPCGHSVACMGCLRILELRYSTHLQSRNNRVVPCPLCRAPARGYRIFRQD